MNTEDFYKLSNFHIDEFDTRRRLISSKMGIIELDLMVKMDEAVGIAKETFGNDAGKFIVHCIVMGDHAKGSQHYIGRAVDGHFKGLNLYQSVMIGFKIGFKGIGYYTWWNDKGIHFDIRDQEHVSTWCSFARDQYSYDFEMFMERLLMEADT